MEIKIRENEKRYHTLFDQAPLGILIIDPQTLSPVEFNEAAHKQLGYSSEEFAKLSLYNFSADETSIETETRVETILRNGKAEFEAKHRTKTGEVRNVIVTAQAVELSGKPYLQSIYRDITEAKKMEFALMESETMYRTLVENAQEGIWTINNEDLTAYVNPHMAEMLGYAENEIKGKKIGVFTDKDTDLAEHNLEGYKLCNHGPIEFVFIRKDGKRIYTNATVSPIRDDKGTYRGAFALISDVTERKKMEQMLEEKIGILEAVTKSIGAGLTVISKDYHIVWINNYLKKLGFTTDKLCYSTFNTLETTCPDCGVKKVFEGASLDAHEYFNTELAQKGLPPWYELIVSPIKDSDGNVTAALELTLNITEKKLLQQQLAEYSQYLEEMVEQKTAQLYDAQKQLVKSERLAAIGQAAAMVGHDLRNPLTGISGAAYYLKMKIGSNAEPKLIQMLDLIEKDIQYSNKIINDLLDYSREIKLELSETTPKAIISESISLVQVPETIEIADSTQTTPRIKMDIAKMKRVFANFIKNAIEAMPQGGKLTILSQTSDNEVEFKFVDSGTGMTKETLDKIWTPFFTTKAKGMGLGLAICRRLIDAHQGKVSVESIVDQGTTVTITFPIKLKPRIAGGEKT